MTNKMWDVFNELVKQTEEFELVGIIGKVPMTNENRIMLMMKLWQKLQYRPTLLIIPKDVTESEALRAQGNKLYVSKSLTKEECLEVFKLYCKSLAFAPTGSKEQAMAYANRSAVLCRMKKYVECLKDIERALGLNYPDALRSKLYLRKIECLAALKHSILDDAIEEAKCWLNRMSINESNCAKFHDKINCLVKTRSLEADTQEYDQSCSLKYSLPVIENPNPEVPCASDAIAIKYNEEYGRHIVATRNIEPGELLVVEKPYSMLLTMDNIRTHCHYCLEVCWNTIPCDSCTYAMYCSEKCKKSDWKTSHDIECSLFPMLEVYNFTKIDLLTIRLTIQAIRNSGGIDNLKKIMKEVDKQTDMRTKGFSKDGVYHSDQYRSVYSLVTNTKKRDGLDILRRVFDSSAIMHLLFLCPNQTLVHKYDVDAHSFVGGLILRHQEIVPSNGHSYCEEVGLLSQDRGLMLLPFQSLINHACDDNVTRISAFGHEIVRAQYPIEKGQQIFCGYHACYALIPKIERQKRLLSQYHFFCGCVPCREDWPLYTDVKSYKVLVTSSAKRNTIAKALTKFNHYFTYAGQSRHSPDTSEIIKDLLHMIRVLYNNAPLPCLEMIDVVETLKRYYALQGNRFDIPEIGECILPAVDNEVTRRICC